MWHEPFALLEISFKLAWMYLSPINMYILYCRLCSTRLKIRQSEIECFMLQHRKGQLWAGLTQDKQFISWRCFTKQVADVWFNFANTDSISKPNGFNLLERKKYEIFKIYNFTQDHSVWAYKKSCIADAVLLLFLLYSITAVHHSTCFGHEKTACM